MPILPRPQQVSLHDAVNYVAERCKCETEKAGKAVLAALSETGLVASANVLVSDRSYMPGIIPGPLPVGPPRRVDAGIGPVPSKLWTEYSWPDFFRRAVLPHGKPMYRERTAAGREVGPIYSAPTILTTDIDVWLDGEVDMNNRPDYQVALSFAGEQREYAERVARALQAKGVKLFYDGFETTRLWGKDGVEFYHKLFASNTSFVVMFISSEYVSKPWTRHERRSALSRALVENTEFILPVRFDNTPVPGLPDTVIYMLASKYSPEALAAVIGERIGISPFASKASDIPPPQMTSNVGEPVFDYSSFNGRYVIGDGPLLFETKWTKANDVSIHLYNDPPSIHGVAIATEARQIADVKYGSTYDFTSRSRTPVEGEVVILQNVNGFYAALRIIEVKDKGRDGCDELRFEYAIQADGSACFEEFKLSNEVG